MHYDRNELVYDSSATADTGKNNRQAKEENSWLKNKNKRNPSKRKRKSERGREREREMERRKEFPHRVIIRLNTATNSPNRPIIRMGVHDWLETNFPALPEAIPSLSFLSSLSRR